MEELIRELTNLGLSEKEAAVYLASLELGSAVVQDISHKARVNRATTYVMIETLTARGLMSTFVKGKKRFYAAETPERLLSLVRMQRKALEEKEQDLVKTLPQLTALFNVQGAKPQIRYLEGSEGLDTVREVIEELEGELIQVVPFDDLSHWEDLAPGRSKHREELERRGASVRALFVTQNGNPGLLPKIAKAEFRVVPPGAFPIHGEITVRGDHVFLHSYKSTVLLSVVIVSREIADTIRLIFDLAWKTAQPAPIEKPPLQVV